MTDRDRPPGSPALFVRAARAVARLGDALGVLGTLWILGLMLLICADVVGRTLFGSPIAGVPEMVSLSIVGIVFLQLASTLRAGRMTRSNLLANRLGARSPRLASALALLRDLTGLLVVLVLVRASLPRFLAALRRDEFVGVVGHFTAPTWPVKLVLVVGAAALVLQFAVDAAENYRSLTARGPDDGT